MTSELTDSETAVLHQFIGDHDYWGPEPFRGQQRYYNDEEDDLAERA